MLLASAMLVSAPLAKAVWSSASLETVTPAAGPAVSASAAKTSAAIPVRHVARRHAVVLMQDNSTLVRSGDNSSGRPRPQRCGGPTPRRSARPCRSCRLAKVFVADPVGAATRRRVAHGGGGTRLEAGPWGLTRS